MGTLIVVLILAAIIGKAIYTLIKDRRTGKCSCGASCGSAHCSCCSSASKSGTKSGSSSVFSSALGSNASSSESCGVCPMCEHCQQK